MLAHEMEMLHFGSLDDVAVESFPEVLVDVDEAVCEAPSFDEVPLAFDSAGLAFGVPDVFPACLEDGCAFEEAPVCLVVSAEVPDVAVGVVESTAALRLAC